jgi:hypothetical protein
MSMPDRPDPTTQAMLRLIPGVGAVMAQWRDETYLRDKERVERMGAATAEVIDGEAVLRAIQEDERVSDMFRDVMSAAVRTGDDNKLGLLGRALASGVLAKDDAAVDEAQQFLRIASELDPVDLRALLELSKSDGISQPWLTVRTRLDLTPALTDVVMARLHRLDLMEVERDAQVDYPSDPMNDSVTIDERWSLTPAASTILRLLVDPSRRRIKQVVECGATVRASATTCV